MIGIVLREKCDHPEASGVAEWEPMNILLTQLLGGESLKDVLQMTAHRQPCLPDFVQRRPLPNVRDAPRVLEVPCDWIGERTPQAHDQEVPGIGQMRGEKGDAVAASSETLARFGVRNVRQSN